MAKPPKENLPKSENTENPEKSEIANNEEVIKGQLGKLFALFGRLLTLLPRTLWKALMLVADLTETTDVEKTISSIKEGVKIKGYNMWILVASTVIASIGLDQNSGAVIIGAMLISPLMSPILGIGLSVGIYDGQTLRDSLKNFLIAIGLSLVTSALYFLITPLGELTPELAARTKPNLLDVGVAFFGGVAGIVAGSRKDITNAIPGVAIATALMPPVCAAGFGLAKLNLAVFAGAIYLFFLNAVFIALSTFLIVRFLKFPLVARVSSNFLRKIFGVVSFFVVLIVVPSIILLVQVVREHSEKRQVETFVKENFGHKETSKVVDWEYQKGDTSNVLRVTLAGDFIPEWEIDSISGQLQNYKFKQTKLRVIQTKYDPSKLNEYGSEIEQVRQIVDLNNEQDEMQQFMIDSLLVLLQPKGDTVPFAKLKREVKAAYPYLTRFSIVKLTSTDFQNRDDTTMTAMVQWQPNLSRGVRKEMEKNLNAFLMERLNLDTCYIMRYN